MRRKPLVYVAGPYRVPDPVTNTRRAITAGKAVRDWVGAVPFIPHLSLLEDLVASETPEYYLAATMDQLRCCDAVYRFTSDYSLGSDAEEAEAITLGIPVFKSLAPLAEWVKHFGDKHESDR